MTDGPIENGGIHGRVVLIGVGNEFRTDDGLGLLVAREMRRRFPEAIAVVENHGDGAALMESWRGADGAILIDAVRSGSAPGTLLRIDATATKIPRFFSHAASSHTFGLADAIEMSRNLHELPPRTIVYGIEGAAFDQGTGLTEQVIKSIPSLISLIESDIHQLCASVP